MPKENKIKPEVVIELTEEQILKIKPLYSKRESLNQGMIFGSLGLAEGKTIGLSYIPHELAMKIVEIAAEQLGENNEI